MSFESVRALEIELDAALEQNDHNYATQIRYNIMLWQIGKRCGEDNFREVNEVGKHRKCTHIECEGTYFIFSKWCAEQGFDSLMETYNNLSGEREDGFTLLDWYRFPDTDLYVSGCFVNGACVYAEIWHKKNGKEGVAGYVILN